MSRPYHELLNYKNQELMNDLNEFFIAVKIHLYNLPAIRKKPTIEEVDILFHQLIQALKKDAETFRK